MNGMDMNNLHGVNKVFLLGEVSREPQIKIIGDNKPVSNLSIATKKEWQDKNTGEWRESTEWHKVVLYDNIANAANTLTIGSIVWIEGHLRTSKWQDKTSGLDRYVTEVIANRLHILGHSSMLKEMRFGEGQAATTPQQNPAQSAIQNDWNFVTNPGAAVKPVAEQNAWDFPPSNTAPNAANQAFAQGNVPPQHDANRMAREYMNAKNGTTGTAFPTR